MQQFEDFFTHEEPIIVQTAQLLAEAKAALDAEQMTKSEFDEIADDIFQLEKVDDFADNLDRKVKFAQAIEALKMIAAAI